MKTLGIKHWLVGLTFFSAASFSQGDPLVVVEQVDVKPLVREVSAHGVIMGKHNVELSAAVAGQLTFVAEPGSSVNRGQVIAEIDLVPLKLQLAEATSNHKRRQVQVQHHTRELARLNELAVTDATARSALDQVATDVALARADLELAEIQLNRLKDLVERASIKAPFSGVISQRFVKSAAQVAVNTPVLHLVDTEQQEVRFYLPAKYFPYVKPGQIITVSSGDGAFSRAEQVAVRTVVPSADQQTQTFELRADIATDSNWASGQQVSIDLLIEHSKSSHLVNRDALLLRADGIYVLKIDEQQVATRVKVNVEGGEGEQVAINPVDKDALKAGDNIAVRGAETVANGQKVQIKQVG